MKTVKSHRRALPAYIDLMVGDVQNEARCDQFGWSSCRSAVCPRHCPAAYAEHMAVHATDSIR